MKPFTTFAIVIFSLMCLMHILRTFFGWEVIFEGSRIPLWISPVGALVAGVVAYMLWRESHSKK
ncbi:MAG: hypothetical protein ACLP9S_13155 [Syntrophales bacterium]